MPFISRPGIAVLMLFAGLAAGPLATVVIAKDSASPTAEYSFSDADSLRDFSVVGNAKIRGSGGVELWNGTPSYIKTHQIFEFPIRAEFEVYCLSDEVHDIFPAILSAADGEGFCLFFGTDRNRRSEVSLFDNVTPVNLDPIKPGHVYKITLSIDASRNAEVTVDGKSVFKQVVPDDTVLRGPLLLSGGRGHVVYKRVRVWAKGGDKPVAERGNGEQVAKNDDEPANAPVHHTDVSKGGIAIDRPTTRPNIPLCTIKALEVEEAKSGILLGQTSDVVLTVTESKEPRPTSVTFALPVGDQMNLARDEALRYIRVYYPNWYADKAELTFQDKYIGHDGGSIGAAIGTLILSSIQGFNIDPDTAITGDISANGKVRAIGGVSAKLRGAVASKCKIVALPIDNYDQLIDTLVYSGLPAVSDVQIIGIANLNDAVAVTRSDRDAKLAKAIELFAGIQTGAKTLPGYLHSKEAIASLNQVLQLEPNHFSARLMLMAVQDKQPKTLSPTASMYYTFVAVRAMLPILAARSQMDNPPAVPSSVVREGLVSLRKLRPMADENVRPLIDAWTHFIGGWSEFQNGEQTRKALAVQAEAVDDAMAKLQADQDLMQKMLKEGI